MLEIKNDHISAYCCHIHPQRAKRAHGSYVHTSTRTPRSCTIIHCRLFRECVLGACSCVRASHMHRALRVVRCVRVKQYPPACVRTSNKNTVLFVSYYFLGIGLDAKEERLLTQFLQRSGVVRCIQFGQKRRANQGSNILELAKENKVIINGVVYDVDNRTNRRPKVRTQRRRLRQHAI